MVHYSSSASHIMLPQNANSGLCGWRYCYLREWLWALRSSWFCSSLHCSGDDIRQITQQVLASFLCTGRKKRDGRREREREEEREGRDGGRKGEKAGLRNCRLYCNSSWYDGDFFIFERISNRRAILINKANIKISGLEIKLIEICISAPETD